MKTILILFIYSLVRPAFDMGKIIPIREILKFPIIFDVTSFLIQLRFLGRLRKLEKLKNNSDFINKVINYNSSITIKKSITKSRRAEIYYKTLGLISQDLINKKILIIGPRNVQELYIAWLYGFKWKNIKAIDLYSTHPKIEIMNMNNLKFPKESFDVVVMANTLPYSDNTELTIKMVSEVLTPSGIFSFGATYYPECEKWPGDKIDGTKIYEYLKNAGFRVFFHNPIEKINSLGGRQTLNNFGAQKMQKNVVLQDKFSL